jgi:hypothetical protein
MVYAAAIEIEITTFTLASRSFFSEENNLHFGDVPTHLPELTQVEEMLIARVHVHVQVFQHRGQQYHYRGHVINFMRDVGRLGAALTSTAFYLLLRLSSIFKMSPRNVNLNSSGAALCLQ